MPKIKILITNQHTNNRGDESAARAMMFGLKKAFGETKLEFIIMKQDEKNVFLNKKGVREIGMITSIKELFTFNLLLLVHLLKLQNFINVHQGKTAEKFKSYLEADLVISAPGGPYFGDLYVYHEIVHLYHVWVAKILKKPLVLYAPSVGPFEKKILNPLRKFIIRKFDLIIVRDPVSKKYLKKLIPKRKIYIAADSCLQQPMKSTSNKKNWAGVTLWGYQTRKDSEKDLEKYKKIMIAYCDHLVEKYKLKIVFLPQLFGKNSDMQLIKDVVKQMNNRARIFPDNKNSTQQQRFISSLKIMVGARYHSIVFSAKNKTPFISIYYEHKAKGFVSMIGLEKFSIGIDEMNLSLLKKKTSQLFREESKTKKQLNTLSFFLQKKSFRSSLLTKDCFYSLRTKLRTFKILKRECKTKKMATIGSFVAKRALKILSFILPESINYKSEILPARHLRFCGLKFWNNKHFLNSAQREADRLSKVNFTINDYLLDVGCGRGRLPIGILSRIGEARHYYGVDINKKAIEWCCKYINRNHPTFRFLHIDVKNSRYNPDGKSIKKSFRFPFASGKFNIIYLYSVFSHMITRDVTIYLKEFHRLLTPSGKILLTAFIEHNGPKITINPKKYKHHWAGPLHCVRYNKSFFESLSTKAGFKVDRLDYERETDGQSFLYLKKN